MITPVTIESTIYPSRVFKYVVPDRIDILETLTIRFTQPYALNDPFELQPIFSQLILDEEFENDIHPSSPNHHARLASVLEKEYDQQPRKIRRQISLEQFVERLLQLDKADPQAFQDEFDKVVPTFKAGLRLLTPKVRNLYVEELSKIGILSLSSEATNPVLWAHYADNGRGFVYEFDATHAFFHSRRSPVDELYHLREVHYRNRDAVGRSLDDLDGNDILCTKTKVWAYEAEWRILAPLEQAKKKVTANGDDVYLFGIPATALKRVILGAKADSSLAIKIESILKNRCDLSHVELARIRPSLETHSMDIISPVNFDPT